MLSLNLARIRSERERVEREYAPGQLDADRESFTLRAPVGLAFDVYKDKDRFHLVGLVTTTLELSCSRCLESFTHGVDQAFDLRYQPRAPHTDGSERELGDDELSTAAYDDEAIDLGELMREQIYLSLPMKPLCRDECRGLCPHCGINLNRGTCACANDWADPRFAALRALQHTRKES